MFVIKHKETGMYFKKGSNAFNSRWVHSIDEATKYNVKSPKQLAYQMNCGYDRNLKQYIVNPKLEAIKIIATYKEV